ncbi:inactive metallocarboxypeptidase Ecm14p [[Candida] jaroonii]|uniref:Inactive metallocarboxypeptidase Ecm14p n=1 Tax=[Candida] jaroonii TaxID=467808 RepID=A0ACA9YE03_9ASCO|nr:inactive metallocarboxypeptidase Ecm14p [[Candida] jaroonii]
MKWLTLLTSITALQLPFFNDPIGSHYSSINPQDHPINLTQYNDDIVIRAHYTEANYAELRKFKIWGKSTVNRTIDIQLTPGDIIQLKKSTGVDYTVIIEDLAQKVYETYPQVNEISTKDSPFKYQMTHDILADMEANIFSELFFKEYRPLETINAWLSLIAESFPDLVKIDKIGETYEHRDYNVIHLSDHSTDNHSDKKTIVITGGVHAREWISVSTVCYQLYSILQHYYNNPDEVLLHNLDFLFIPVLNPDGYVYSWETDRLWRKNRQETINPKCFGIDIDHSYDFHWTKSSDWPCGEEYSGELPFESIESKIWNEYLTNNNHNHEIFGYIDLHSYSQEILFPFAFSCTENPRDEENLLELAYGISKSMRQKHGKTYNVLPACQDKDADLLPDLGSGTALDFMYHNKAYWAYQLKLRDSGNHGFLLPSKYIEPVGEEVFEGIKYFCGFILEE